MIVYCQNCIIPSTRPDIEIDESGVCNACKAFKNRTVVDWEKRKTELLEIVKKFKTKDYWDCVVPVSGGKDSTYQVLKVLELGLKPLCVLSSTCQLSKIGRDNIENLKKIGVDFVEFTPNPSIRKKLNYIGLTVVGDIAWPEHIGIFTIPVSVAIKFKIPLIVWGENSQNEYGGPDDAQKKNILDRRWLEEFGGLIGLRVTDLVDVYGFPKKDLVPYFYPEPDILEKSKIMGIFLGHYIPWNSVDNAKIAKERGFSFFYKQVEGSYFEYENLDNLQHGIHDYFKFLKFGFGRATDQLSVLIRRGLISRSEAIEIAKKIEGKFPWKYLDIGIEAILNHLGISLEEFEDIANQFTNYKIFKTDNFGKLIKDNMKNLTKIKYDN
jgi:N-acetyl sugar amidotransferase